MSKEKHISIIGGAGHVGFPLGLILSAKGFKVNLIDKNSKNINKINKGKVPFIEENSKNLLINMLKKKRIFATNKLSEITKSKYIIICIGTTISPISLKRTQSITRCAVYYSVASCKLILHFTPKASLVLQCWAVRPMSLIHQRSDFALGFHCSVQAGENFVLGDSSNYRYSASQVIYAWPLTSPWSR